MLLFWFSYYVSYYISTKQLLNTSSQISRKCYGNFPKSICELGLMHCVANYSMGVVVKHGLQSCKWLLPILAETCSKLSGLHLHHCTWIRHMSASTVLKQRNWKNFLMVYLNGLIKTNSAFIFETQPQLSSFFKQKTIFRVNGSPDSNALYLVTTSWENSFSEKLFKQIVGNTVLNDNRRLNQRLLSCHSCISL